MIDRERLTEDISSVLDPIICDVMFDYVYVSPEVCNPAMSAFRREGSGLIRGVPYTEALLLTDSHYTVIADSIDTYERDHINWPAIREYAWQNGAFFTDDECPWFFIVIGDPGNLDNYALVIEYDELMEWMATADI